VREEFLWRKNHPTPALEKMDLAMERKKHFGNRIQQEAKKRFA